MANRRKKILILLLSITSLFALFITPFIFVRVTLAFKDDFTLSEQNTIKITDCQDEVIVRDNDLPDFTTMFGCNEVEFDLNRCQDKAYASYSFSLGHTWYGTFDKGSTCQIHIGGEVENPSYKRNSFTVCNFSKELLTVTKDREGNFTSEDGENVQGFCNRISEISDFILNFHPLF